VLRFLCRVIVVAGLRGGLGESDDGVTVLACVVRELVSAELTAAPALVEGVLEQVPSRSSGIESVNKFHRGSFRREGKAMLTR
jgi:hypothetical protein